MVFRITHSLDLTIRSAFKVKNKSLFFFPETLGLCVYCMNERTVQSTHQPKNVHNKI